MKKRLYDILENDNINDGPKFFFDLFLGTIILISIVIIIIENIYDELHPAVSYIDDFITLLFIIEFILRFYVASDFIKDIKGKSLGFAMLQKIRWFFQITTLIDFLAIIPSISFFRVFRTVRFIRFFRIFKAYRSIKIFREIDKIFTILKGMKEESRIFYVFFSLTLFFMIIISFALYISESDHPESELNNFKDSVWFAIKIIGFGDDTPRTFIGKVFSGFLLLFNMAIFGFFVSIILNKIQKIMDSITSGKIGKIKLTNHIVICGYTKSSRNVIQDLLEDKTNFNNIVLITEKELDEDLNGVLYINADYTDTKVLNDANIHEAEFAIVFAESKLNASSRDIDLRTVLTIFHIEKINPAIHTIAEINDEENAEIIKDKIQGDEILYKERIDSRIISNCIKHKNISNMLYDLFGETNNERIAEATLENLKLSSPISVKDIKLFFIELESTFLGFIDDKNKSHLSPANNILVDDSHRIIYIS